MSEQLIHKPAVVVVTGTHSSGKSTLISDIEAGKLTELGIYDHDYSDFGYGLLETDDGRHPYVTVPEAARRLADLSHNPGLLAEDYTLDFQLEVESDALFRVHTASAMAEELTADCLRENIISADQGEINPVVISDRGSIDGIIYSKLRIPGENLDIVNNEPRTWFLSEWLKSFVNLVVITDYKDIPFQPDQARLADAEFRQIVGEIIENGYRQFLDEDSVVVIGGNRAVRRSKLLALLGQIGGFSSIASRQTVPYENWRSIELDISTK
jgi:hypothetical protein